ncbi:nickel pincer cofactor biosynthesis protein LarB [Chloroflexota bacterium]
MKDVLEKLARGEISPAEAERILRAWTIQEVGDLARLDTGRDSRRGMPEVIIAEGKTARDVVDITLGALRGKGRAIVSRASRQHIQAIKKAETGSVTLQVNQKARMVIIKSKDFVAINSGGRVGIMTAGTSDIPVAEEARIIAEEMGCEVVTAYDLGIAGIHRLFAPLKEMLERDVDVMVVVAGREGALPSIVAGMIDIPVIAVPSSQGYGLGEKGVSALMAMLQACSLGMGVVNIDGGVPAGTIAGLIANRASKFRAQH